MSARCPCAPSRVAPVGSLRGLRRARALWSGALAAPGPLRRRVWAGLLAVAPLPVRRGLLRGAALVAPVLGSPLVGWVARNLAAPALGLAGLYLLSLLGGA